MPSLQVEYFLSCVTNFATKLVFIRFTTCLVSWAFVARYLSTRAKYSKAFCRTGIGRLITKCVICLFWLGCSGWCSSAKDTQTPGFGSRVSYIQPNDSAFRFDCWNCYQTGWGCAYKRDVCQSLWIGSPRGETSRRRAKAPCIDVGRGRRDRQMWWWARWEENFLCLWMQ